MKTAIDIVGLIDANVEHVLLRPKMHSMTPDGLEEQFMLLQALKDYILENEDTYDAFSRAHGVGAGRRFTTRFYYPRPPVSEYDEKVFQELIRFIKSFLEAQGKAGVDSMEQ